MTNSDEPDRARIIIERVRALLDAQRIQHTIDEPIDRAAALVRVERGPCASQRHVHQLMATIVQRVFEHGLRLNCRLTPSQAVAEALALLKESGPDYHRLLLEATKPSGDGAAIVRAHLAEAIKQRERRNYTQWVFATYLGTCSSALRCRIVELFRDQYCPFLPSPLSDWPAGLLIDALPRMLSLDLETSRELQSGASPFHHPSA